MITPLYLNLPDPPTAGSSPQAYSQPIDWTPLASGFDLRMKLYLVNWGNTTFQRLIGNRSDASAAGTFGVELFPANITLYYRRNNGTINTVTVAPPMSGAGTLWLRFTFDSNLQPLGQDVWAIYDSTDGVHWNTLGTEQLAFTTALNVQSNPMSIGNEGLTIGNSLQGKVYYADVRTRGVTPVTLATFDPSQVELGKSSFTDAQGNTWNVQSGASLTIQKCPRWHYGRRPYRRVRMYT